MNLSPAGLAFIKRHEGFSSKPYRCPGGVMTIGYGHAILPHETFGKISESYASELLRQDIQQALALVDKHVTVPLTQGQYDAMVSIMFNVGPGKQGVKDGIVTLKTGSPSTLLRKLNQGDYAGAAAQFERWVFAGGKPLGGLEKRRVAERDMFLSTVT